jgi:hypothetical protein
MERVENIEGMEQIRNQYKILAEKLERNTLIGDIHVDGRIILK